LNEFKKKLSNWINNYNSKKGSKIKYLLIPEMHKDNSWHMHGLIQGIPIEHLTEFEKTDKLPLKMLMILHQDRKLYNWQAYQKSFGFISMEKVLNAEAISKYITKYITKDIVKSQIKLNDHIYYCSHGLKRAEKIYTGELRRSVEADFENDYIASKTVRSIEEAREYFIDDE
jgi:hypothetical protein